MSDSDTSEVSAQIYSDLIWLLTTYTSASASCLWVLNFLQTLPAEIEAVWKSKLNLPAILFLLNRYGYTLGIIISMPGSVPGLMTNIECQVTNVMPQLFTMGPLLCTNLLFTLRVYATSNKNKAILLVAIVLLLARLATDIWQATLSIGISTKGYPGVQLASCEDELVVADESLVNWSYVASGCLALVFDGFIFGVTFLNLHGHTVTMREIVKKKSVAEILLRDGRVYFIIMFLVAATQAGLALFSALKPQSDILSNIMDPYFQGVPNLLINHLYLNIRRTSPRPQPDHFFRNIVRPEQPFPQNRLLGNIGGPLDYDQLDSQFNPENFMSEDSEVVDESANAINAATTLVPVIYDNCGAVSNADIEMMPIERDSPGAGPSQAQTQSGLTAQL